MGLKSQNSITIIIVTIKYAAGVLKYACTFQNHFSQTVPQNMSNCICIKKLWYLSTKIVVALKKG